MTEPLEFSVIGVPGPQGSKKLYGTRLVESSRLVAPWRQAVAYSARSAMNRDSHPGFPDGPVSLQVLFLLSRPVSARKAERWQAKRPDLDKLLRATLDALTESGVIGDDGQVACIRADKMLAAAGAPATGASMRLAAL